MYPLILPALFPPRSHLIFCWFCLVLSLHGFFLLVRLLHQTIKWISNISAKQKKHATLVHFAYAPLLLSLCARAATANMQVKCAMSITFNYSSVAISSQVCPRFLFLLAPALAGTGRPECALRTHKILTRRAPVGLTK